MWLQPMEQNLSQICLRLTTWGHEVANIIIHSITGTIYGVGRRSGLSDAGMSLLKLFYQKGRAQSTGLVSSNNRGWRRFRGSLQPCALARRFTFR